MIEIMFYGIVMDEEEEDRFDLNLKENNLSDIHSKGSLDYDFINNIMGPTYEAQI